MNEIQITAEDLIREALKRYVLNHSTPGVLIGETIRDLYPNSNGETVRAIALENSVANGIRKIERQAAAHESDFERVGQLTLWGDLIPEHRVPKQLMHKTVAEMQAWMEDRARIEQENADEMNRAADRQQRRAKQFSEWNIAVTKVRDAVLSMRLDPMELSYAEALRKAETVQPGSESISRAAAKQPVR